MANSQVQQTKVPQEPSLKDLLDLFQKQIMLLFNCHHVGTVQSFNPTTQQATATINYLRTYFQQDTNPQSDTFGTSVPKLVSYPTLIDCPVMFLGGGSTSLTFPVSKGDECIVLFNDRDIDNWFSGSSGSPVATSRLHSFSDAIILVGVRSKANVLSNFDTTRAALKDKGGAMVGVHSTLVKIANNTTTLNTLLQSLVTNIQNLVTATATITVTGVTSGGALSGPPANATVITAVGTALGTLASQIGGLLE